MKAQNQRVHIVYKIGRNGTGYGVVAVFESRKDAYAMVEKSRHVMKRTATTSTK